MSGEVVKAATVSGLRIEQVSGAVEASPNGVHSVEITTEEQSAITTPVDGKGNESDEEDDEEPSVLQALSSEQLARRASFKRILDDLSSADQTLKGGADPLSAAAAATLQAHQAVLQQAAASGLTNPGALIPGLTNPALLPGILQGMQQNLATPASTSSSASTGEVQLPTHLSMMLPSQQSVQLQSALLGATSLASTSQSPLIAGVQSLASQTTLPASLLSSAILNANMVSLSTSPSTVSSATGPTILTVSPPKPAVPVAVGSPASQVLDDTTRKREVRLMKNREAARECRRKKKEYVRCLENRVAVLESQNQALIGELRALKELYLPKSQE